MSADELTPAEYGTFSRVYGPAPSEFLADLGPVWSKKRCPEGPLGRSTQQSLKFITTQMLPMLPEVFNFEVSYSPVFRSLAQKIRSTENTLVVGNHYSGHHGLSMDFVDNLAVSARVVLEYRRKAVRISKDGDVNFIQNNIPQQDSGLTMTQPQQTVLRSGGDPEAYLRSFD